jgi:hypothetical protein
MSQLNILGNLCEMYGNCVCQICVNIDLKLNGLIQCSGDSYIYLLVPDKLNYNIMFNLVYKVVNFGFVCFQFSGPYTFEESTCCVDVSVLCCIYHHEQPTYNAVNDV